MEENKFSFYNAPVTSKHKPVAAWGLLDAYQYITKSKKAKEATYALRAIADSDKRRKYKATNFDFATFSGTFSGGGAANLIQHSGLLCLDIDHIGGKEQVEELKAKLIADKELDVRLAMTSPSNDGLKVIAPIAATDAANHKLWFKAMFNYIKTTYHVEPDPSGSDVCRACFLPYDPDCFIKISDND